MSMTPKQLRDFWQTPPEIYNYLNRAFSFDVDLAAGPENTLHRVFLQDSLAFPWHVLGATGFCNPPYSNQKGFLTHALAQADAGFISVFLIPCFNGAQYWGPLAGVAHISNIIGRLAFIAPESYTKADGVHVSKGDRVGGNDSGSCIVQIGGARRLPEWILREDLK